MGKKILISELMRNYEKAIQEIGFTKSSIVNYRCQGMNPILKSYCDAGKVFYSKKFDMQIIYEVESSYEKGEISKVRKCGIRKVAVMLNEFYETGEVTLKKICTGSKTKLKSAYYLNILEKFKETELSAGIRTERTIISEVILLRHFFYWLESNKCVSLEKISLKDISDFLTYFAGENHGSICKMNGTLRKFYEFTKQYEVPSIDYLPALVASHSKRRKLRHAITKTESEKILSSINTMDPIGKRDYSILMIAKSLGMRIGDILSLKLNDVKWEKNEIVCEQNKTGVELILPLIPCVGNAIASYILNGRPETDSEYIFVRHLFPIKKLDSAGSIFYKYSCDMTLPKGTGFHSFRRSFASDMLNASVETDTVKNILGHTQIDSLKPYARISDIRLKSCAIPLDGIEVLQEELI